MRQPFANNSALNQWEFKLKPGGILVVTLTQKNTGAWAYREVVIDDPRHEQPYQRVRFRQQMDSAHYRPGWRVSQFTLWQAINAGYASHLFWKGESKVTYSEPVHL